MWFAIADRRFWYADVGICAFHFRTFTFGPAVAFIGSVHALFLAIANVHAAQTEAISSIGRKAAE